MNTLLLDQDTWDLVLDINGNIAVAAAPYALAQDVASAVRTFTGDMWYDQTAGIPYFERVLGEVPNLAFIRTRCEEAALTVPGVVTARCVFAELTADRVLRGQIQFIDTDGVSRNVTF